MTPCKKYFANYGSEKMIFDVRMGPQALGHNGVIYIVYQANQADHAAHPHIISYHRATRSWSNPVRLGENPPRYDHHKGPVIWMDSRCHIHILYGCHITPGTHLISKKPESILEWEEGPQIAGTISYPSVHSIYEGKLLLLYRALGHMGYWAYRISGDGGYSWTDERRVIDFDFNPREGEDGDSWAGSYISANPNLDGTSLHIGFVYWDERKRPHPVYKIGKRSKKRYNLYCIRLDILTGKLFSIDGKVLTPPVNRGMADEECKIWDTGHELSNMPSISVGGNDEPFFLLPASDKSPWHCNFQFIARVDGRWRRTIITETNGNWAGCFLQQRGLNDFCAFLVVGEEGERLLYSGGTIQKWISKDGGNSWNFDQALIPEPGYFYNNPKPVHLLGGGCIEDHLVMFGWEGPGSIQSDPSQHRNRGRAYLWNNGQWL